MSGRPVAGRVFSAVAFVLVGVGLGVWLPEGGPSPGVSRVVAGGAVDVGFAQDMVVHHQQAVTMAQVVRGRVGPSVAGVASAMELNQVREIGVMQGWLALWGAPQVPSGAAMTWMGGRHKDHKDHGDHGGHGGGVMPGMASQEEIGRLGEGEGEEVEVWFLKLMIRHHEGGLVMAAEAARRAGHPQVRALALVMAAEQREEIAVMGGLLAALGHGPLPSPVGG
ncbi:DUF305 domain-containing protein [Planomonospora corallina]|uniref:DUF305 domain-containing protein n=1 Tax=Planomonospora corallina TaxID=1806052 RepID=A0ABV8IFR8_9ACTN